MAVAAPLEASIFFLEEVGTDYGLTLRGRGLPYRPVTFGGKSRVQFNWYPGSPTATAQVLGPEESSIQFKGYWKDRFIQTPNTDVQYSTEGAVVSGPTVRDLTAYVDTFRKRGQLCKLQWDVLTRYGYVTEFQQTWHNQHDCEWELTFSPIAQDTPSDNVATSPSKTFSQAYYGAAQAVDSFNTQLAQAASDLAATLKLPYVDATTALLNSAQDTLAVAAGSAYNIATSATSNVLNPPQAAQQLVSRFLAFQNSIAATVTTLSDRAIDTYVSFVAYGGQDFAPLATQIAAYNYRANTKERLKTAQKDTAEQVQNAFNLLSEPLLGVYTAKLNDDLRDVSIQFYKTPDYWAYLRDFNYLESSKLTEGTVVLVPQLSVFQNNNTPTQRGY